MPIPVNSIVQVSFRGTWEGQRILLTQNYIVSATTSGATIPQDLVTINGWFALGGAGSFRANYLACLPTDYTLDFIRSQVISPGRSVYVDQVIGVAGAFPALASTGNLQFPITLHTDLGGRNQIAVKKIGPAPDNTYSGGAPDPVYKSGPLAAFATELTQTQVTLGFEITMNPVVYHGNGTSNMVAGARLPDRVGTMRRRTLRVGE